MRIVAAACLLAGLLCPGPAVLAQDFAAPPGATSVVFGGEALDLRSEALGRTVRVKIHLPPVGQAPWAGAVVYALVDPPEVEWIAARLRQRQLETSTYGLVVVTIETPGPENREAWERRAIADFVLTDRELYSGELIAARPEAFERFLYDELMPLVAETWPVRGETILAGQGWAGAFVLSMAARRLDGVDHHIAVDPRLQPGDAALIIEDGVDHPSGHAGHMDVAYARDSEVSPVEIEQLLAWLYDHGHSVNVAVDTDADADLIVDVAAGESLVPPY